MNATTLGVPWWYFAGTALAITAVLGLLAIQGVGLPVQIGAVALLLLGLVVAIRRHHA